MTEIGYFDRIFMPLLLICAALVLPPRCDTSEGLASIPQNPQKPPPAPRLFWSEAPHRTGLTFSTCPLVRSSVRPSITKRVNTIF